MTLRDVVSARLQQHPAEYVLTGTAGVRQRQSREFEFSLVVVGSPVGFFEVHECLARGFWEVGRVATSQRQQYRQVVGV